jgi:hypothetical protein
MDAKLPCCDKVTGHAKGVKKSLAFFSRLKQFANGSVNVPVNYEIAVKKMMLAILLSGGLVALIPASLSSQPLMLGQRAPDQQAVLQRFSTPPATLVLPAGTVITIEVSELVSSDLQQSGDHFAAALHHPLVVDGWVIARPGQTVVGRIADAKKAGRVQGTSKLTLELEHLVLADGYQASIQTDLMENFGPASHGRDLTVVAITTGAGAAIGSICGSKSAAIGAAAGATAGIAGVLLTRGKKVEIGPEQHLTFRLSSPLVVSTGETRHAFWQVTPGDYPAPGRTSPAPKMAPAATVIAQQASVRIPLSVWSGIQGLGVGHVGSPACRN